MASEISQGKTICVLAVVAGCFAVLWPSLFYPMLKGSFGPQHQTGCCDVVSSSDMNLVKIITDICDQSIGKVDKKRYWEMCRREIYNTCAINVTDLVSGNQVGVIDSSNKHVVDKIRSLNGSLCLKYHYGVSLTSLGVEHRLKEYNPKISNIPQERIPVHLKATKGTMHPALLEKGRAIPQPHIGPRHSGPPTPHSFKPTVQGSKPPMPGMGGANNRLGGGEGSTMNILMPMYTIGIILFFVYTMMKLLTKKNEDENYPYEKQYLPRKYSLNDDDNNDSKQQLTQNGHPKLGFVEKDTSEIEIDALRRKLEETEAAMERIVKQMILASECNRMEGTKEHETCPKEAECVDSKSINDISEVTCSTDLSITNKSDKNLCNDVEEGDMSPRSEVLGKKVIQVVNMETSEGVEGGHYWTPKEQDIKKFEIDKTTSEPISLFIPGPIPKHSQLLVSDGPHNTPGETENYESVVSSKVTLSLIPDDRENSEESIDENEAEEDDENEEEEDDEINDKDDYDDGCEESEDGSDDNEKYEYDEDTTKTNTPTKTS
ncbi:uncharacterized protein LOC126896907 isoform X2 [Daktulosphaira vitifoliae]|uniref:uncharacterized protein LOC126896907 isoform X2 n=1 Tax=Daktulosphaira vitifoliae TaxID=58002 RepID=UPI0021AABC87|nr:uncharacterized protein LOC126896907 isoform X2 [Daktulosphaira vitifoliae]